MLYVVIHLYNVVYSNFYFCFILTAQTTMLWTYSSKTASRQG